jgi:hypothetical protein
MGETHLRSQRVRRRQSVRAVIYARVSKASRSRYGEVVAYDQRPERQEEPLRKLAEQEAGPSSECTRIA